MVSLSRLWTSETPEPGSPCLSRSSPRRDSTCLPRTQQPARSHAHIWRFSHGGVELDQKKGAQLPPLSTALVAPDPDDPTSMILERHELWSFVLKKANASWMWIALCRKTRQVVAYAVGDRSKKTCQRLWEAIPEGYRHGHCFTDFWAAYPAVLPEEQHFAVGKETGETAHVERWNKTLRQRLARFVRMMLSFSKSAIMHEICLLLFLHRYNRERAILFK
jgi:insertion element IS1 protein InsB